MKHLFSCIIILMALAGVAKSAHVCVEILTLPTGTYPVDVSPLADGSLCVSSAKKRALFILSEGGSKITTKILPVPVGLLTPTKDEKKVYFTSLLGKPSLFVYEFQADVSVVVNMPMDARLGEVALSEDEKVAYIVDNKNPLLYIVNLDKRTIIRTVNIPSPCDRIMFFKNRVYLIPISINERQEDDKAKIIVLDVLKLENVKLLPIKGNEAAALTCDKKRDTIYVLSGDGVLNPTCYLCSIYSRIQDFEDKHATLGRKFAKNGLKA